MSNLTAPPGFPYALKAPVPHDDLNHLCEQVVKAPNLNEGSAHTPTGTVDIDGGAGGGFTFTNNAVFDGFLKVLSLNFDADVLGAIGLSKRVLLFIRKHIEFGGGAGEPSRLIMGSRSRMNVPPYRLGDGNHTINATETSSVIILAKPTAARTITIEQASDTAKVDGDAIEFYMPVSGTDPSTDYWIIKREGSASNIAVMTGGLMGGLLGAGSAFCRVHLEGGVWRLTGGAGVNRDADA